MKASRNNTITLPERLTAGGTVLKLVPRKAAKPEAPEVNEETVQLLELMLKRARAGEMSGLAWVAIAPGRGFYCDTAGEASISPTFTRGALRSLDDRLAARINAARFE